MREPRRRVLAVPEEVSGSGVIRVVRIDHGRRAGRRHEREVAEKCREPSHRARQSDLRADRERRREPIPLERVSEGEHVALADIHDAAVAHRLDECWAGLDRNCLEPPLKPQRVPARPRSEVDERARKPRCEPRTRVALGVERVEVERPDRVFTRLLAVALSERGSPVTTVMIADRASEGVRHAQRVS